ncbi:MAG: hypothetical protein QOC97_628, partial [Chloroflexota bacterium]|nr:hypothetical protein [Chloroflexota bacterium]
GDRGVGQKAEEGANALATAGTAAIETEVVADHRVGAGGRVVVIADEAKDLPPCRR